MIDLVSAGMLLALGGMAIAVLLLVLAANHASRS